MISVEVQTEPQDFCENTCPSVPSLNTEKENNSDDFLQENSDGVPVLETGLASNKEKDLKDSSTKENVIIESDEAKHGDTFQCGKCYRRLKTLENLKIHQELHIKYSVYSCTICNLDFQTRKEINAHRITVHRIKTTVFDKNNLVAYIPLTPINYIPKKEICEICGKQFATSTRLKYHKKLHQNENAYQCDICHKNFASPTSLREHKDGVHFGKKAEVGSFICELCGESVKKYRRYHHLEKVHGHKPTYNCNQCHVGLWTERGMRNHKCQIKGYVKKVGGNGEIILKKYTHKCRFCPKMFNDKRKREAHENQHQGLMPYKCHLCPKKFCGFRLRKNHIKRVHQTFGKKYSCDICGQKFKLPKGLYQHKSVHSKERPFGCPVCGIKFKRSGDRNKHQRDQGHFLEKKGLETEISLSHSGDLNGKDPESDVMINFQSGARIYSESAKSDVLNNSELVVIDNS